MKIKLDTKLGTKRRSGNRRQPIAAGVLGICGCGGSGGAYMRLTEGSGTVPQVGRVPSEEGESWLPRKDSNLD